MLFLRRTAWSRRGELDAEWWLKAKKGPLGGWKTGLAGLQHWNARPRDTNQQTASQAPLWQHFTG